MAFQPGAFQQNTFQGAGTSFVAQAVIATTSSGSLIAGSITRAGFSSSFSAGAWIATSFAVDAAIFRTSFGSLAASALARLIVTSSFDAAAILAKNNFQVDAIRSATIAYTSPVKTTSSLVSAPSLASDWFPYLSIGVTSETDATNLAGFPSFFSYNAYSYAGSRYSAAGWVKLQIPTGGSFTGQIDTIGSNDDTILSIFLDAPSGANPTPTYGDDDGGGGYQSLWTGTLTAGTWYIAVSGYYSYSTPTGAKIRFTPTNLAGQPPLRVGPTADAAIFKGGILGSFSASAIVTERHFFADAAILKRIDGSIRVDYRTNRGGSLVANSLVLATFVVPPTSFSLGDGDANALDVFPYLKVGETFTVGPTDTTSFSQLGRIEYPNYVYNGATHRAGWIVIDLTGGGTFSGTIDAAGTSYHYSSVLSIYNGMFSAWYSGSNWVYDTVWTGSLPTGYRWIIALTSDSDYPITEGYIRVTPSALSGQGPLPALTANAYVNPYFTASAWLTDGTRVFTTTTIDAYFVIAVYLREASLTANAYIPVNLITTVGGLNLDAWVKSTLTESFSADAELTSKTKTASFTVSSETMKTGERRGTVTATAYVKAIISRTFRVNALVSSNDVIRVDAWIQPQILANAIIFAGRSATFTASSWFAGTITASAVVIRKEDAVLAADAIVADANGAFPGRVGTFQAEALILGRKSWFVWLAAIIDAPRPIKADSWIAPYFWVDAFLVTQTGGMGVVTVDAYVRGVDFVVWPEDGGPPVDANGNPFPSWFNATAREYRIQITINDVDVTGDVIWAETRFQQMAKTGAGTFELAFLGSPSYMGGEEVRLFIDGMPAYGGYVLMVERTYVFGSDNQPKTVLRGADYNILLDRLVVWNKPWSDAYYKRTGKQYGPYQYWKPFPKGTMDDVIIKKVAKDYMLWPAGFDVTSEIDAVSTPAPVTSWLLPEAGTPLRQTLQSISQVTSAVFYIDAYRRLNYHDRFTATENVPALTDGLGGISSQGMVVTDDATKLITSNIVWGTLATTVEGEITYAKRTSSELDQYGFWQYGEFRADIHHKEWLNKRSESISKRFGRTIPMVRATVFEPGYQAGQVVNVISSQYGFEQALVIREANISFAVAREPHSGNYYAMPKYDLALGLEPESPWNIYDYLPYPTETGTTNRTSTMGYTSFHSAIDAPPLDIILVSDTTGSMADYYAAVKEQFQTLVTNIKETYSDIRIGLATYGDRQNGYDVSDWSTDYPLTYDYDAVYAAIEAWTVRSGDDFDEQWIRTFWELTQDLTPINSRPSNGGWEPTPAMGTRDDAYKLVVWFGDAASHWGIEPTMDDQQTKIGVSDVIDLAIANNFVFFGFDVSTNAVKAQMDIAVNSTTFDGVAHPDENDAATALTNATNGALHRAVIDYPDGWQQHPTWAWNVVKNKIDSQGLGIEFVNPGGWGCEFSLVNNSIVTLLALPKAGTLSMYDASNGVFLAPYTDYQYYDDPDDGTHYKLLKTGISEVIACYLAMPDRIYSRPTSPKNSSGEVSVYRTGMLGKRAIL